MPPAFAYLCRYLLLLPHARDFPRFFFFLFFVFFEKLFIFHHVFHFAPSVSPAEKKE